MFSFIADVGEDLFRLAEYPISSVHDMGSQYDHVFATTARIFLAAHMAGQNIADFTCFNHALHLMECRCKSRQMSHLDKIASPFGQLDKFVCLNKRFRKRLLAQHMATMVQRIANLFDMFAWKP